MWEELANYFQIFIFMIIVNNFFIILFFIIFIKIIFIANINFKETENDKVGGSTWTPVKVNSDISPGPRK